jgi:undecaprenyl-diphosphatase
MYRRVQPRDLGDEKAFSSLRRTVEHEAMVSLMARDLEVPTPRVLAFATVEPNAFVLAYEAIDGKSLDRVPVEDLSDEIVVGLWRQLAVLRSHRIAHRDLRLANLFLRDDGSVMLIDFGFSELAASDLLLATDLAELLTSLALAIGPERSVASASAVIGATDLETAIARLKPFALSGATRTGLKEQPGLLEELRVRVERAPSADQLA